mgnify:CR=1 FL=1
MSGIHMPPCTCGTCRALHFASPTQALSSSGMHSRNDVCDCYRLQWLQQPPQCLRQCCCWHLIGAKDCRQLVIQLQLGQVRLQTTVAQRQGKEGQAAAGLKVCRHSHTQSERDAYTCTDTGTCMSAHHKHGQVSIHPYSTPEKHTATNSVCIARNAQHLCINRLAAARCLHKLSTVVTAE